MAQYAFTFNSYLGGSLLGLKVIFVIFDLLTAFILIKWLRLRNLPVALSLFYLLNPVVIKEIANSAHLDSILVFFFTTAAYLIDKCYLNSKGVGFVNQWRKTLLSSFLLAVATLIKISPAFALPAFIKHSKHCLLYTSPSPRDS